MNRNCNLENVVYQANIFPYEGNFNEKEYLWASSLKLKFKYYNQWQSFNNLLLKKQPALYKYYWKIKDQGLTPIINRKII